MDEIIGNLDLLGRQISCEKISISAEDISRMTGGENTGMTMLCVTFQFGSTSIVLSLSSFEMLFTVSPIQFQRICLFVATLFDECPE